MKSKKLKKYLVIKFSGSYTGGMAIITPDEKESFIKKWSRDSICPQEHFEIVAEFDSPTELETPVEYWHCE